MLEQYRSLPKRGTALAVLDCETNNTEICRTSQLWRKFGDRRHRQRSVRVQAFKNERLDALTTFQTELPSDYATSQVLLPFVVQSS